MKFSTVVLAASGSALVSAKMSSMSKMHSMSTMAKGHMTSSMGMGMDGMGMDAVLVAHKTSSMAKMPGMTTTMAKMPGMTTTAKAHKTTSMPGMGMGGMDAVLVADKTTKSSKTSTTLSKATKTSSKASKPTAAKYTYHDVLVQMKKVYALETTFNKTIDTVTEGGFGQVQQLENLQAADNNLETPGTLLYNIVTGSAPFGLAGSQAVSAVLLSQGPGELGILSNLAAHKMQFSNGLDVISQVVSGLQAEQKSSVALTRAYFSKMVPAYQKSLPSVIAETNKAFEDAIKTLSS